MQSRLEVYQHLDFVKMIERRCLGHFLEESTYLLSAVSESQIRLAESVDISDSYVWKVNE